MYYMFCAFNQCKHNISNCSKNMNDNDIMAKPIRCNTLFRDKDRRLLFPSELQCQQQIVTSISWISEYLIKKKCTKKLSVYRDTSVGTFVNCSDHKLNILVGGVFIDIHYLKNIKSGTLHPKKILNIYY